MAVSQKTKEKWKQQAIESQKKAHQMIHDIGLNYIREPKQIAEMLEFGSKFYNYSIHNMELIYTQNSGAMYVQSFDAWKKANTSVLKGQKGIKILVPVQLTMLLLGGDKTVRLSDASKEQKEMYKSGKIQGKTVLHFKVGNVFDISQTDFPPERYPELFSVGYDSKDHEKVVQGIENYCKELDISVSYEDLNSITRRGYFSPGNNCIVINKLLNDTQKLSTLSHELGHALEKHGDRAISAAQMEFEADSISILIQSHFGLELTDIRKAHLAENYREFESELKKENPQLTEDEILKCVENALTASITVFREHIEKLQGCVEKVIPCPPKEPEDVLKEKHEQKDTTEELSEEENIASPRL